MQRKGLVLITAATVTAFGAGFTLVSVRTASGHAALSTSTLTQTPHEARSDGPQIRETAAGLLRAGIHPHMLAAAGADGEDLTAILNALQQAEGDPCSALLAAEAHVGTARAEVQRLSRLASSGLATQNDLTALSAARASLASAITARDTYSTTIRGLAANQLGQQAQANLAAACGNARHNLPCTYAPTVDTQADALTLKRALAAQRTAQRWNEETPAQAAAVIAAADVAAGATSTALHAHHHSVMTAWNNAIE